MTNVLFTFVHLLFYFENYMATISSLFLPCVKFIYYLKSCITDITHCKQDICESRKSWAHILRSITYVVCLSMTRKCELVEYYDLYRKSMNKYIQAFHMARLKYPLIYGLNLHIISCRFVKNMWYSTCTLLQLPRQPEKKEEKKKKTSNVWPK